MSIDYNPKGLSGIEYVQERAHRKTDKQPNYFMRRAGVLLSVLAFTIGADSIAAQDQQFCAITPGAPTVWENGVETVHDLREQGAKIRNITSVIDPLNELPHSQGNMSGNEVCAFQTTGITGSILGTNIEITPIEG